MIGKPTQLRPKLKGPGVKAGDVVFFRRFKESASVKSKFIEVPGHAFGVLLGQVPPFQADPPKEFITQTLGALGLILFDDVLEFVGADITNELLKKFEAKYCTDADPTQAELPLEGQADQESEPPAPPRSKLLGLDGKPIESLRPPESSL